MSLLSQALGTIKPKLIITAPDGKKLYVDVADQSVSGDGGSSLWPNGFKVSLGSGEAPISDPNVTTSPSTFFVQQSPVLLSAPGPLEVPWGVWLFVLGVLTLLPLAAVYFIAKK